MILKTLCEFVDDIEGTECPRDAMQYYVAGGPDQFWYIGYCADHNAAISPAALTDFTPLTRDEYLIHVVLHQ